MAAYLLVIGDREALGWILDAQAMAFRSLKRPHVSSLGSGDLLFLYTTRSCFKNPGRDRGRIIGQAVITESVSTLEEPVEFGGRLFPVGCDIRVRSLVPLGQGVELVPLLDRLGGIKTRGGSWTFQLRQPLVMLTEDDCRLISDQLSGRSPTSVRDSGYLKWHRTGPMPE